MEADRAIITETEKEGILIESTVKEKRNSKSIIDAVNRIGRERWWAYTKIVGGFITTGIGALITAGALSLIISDPQKYPVSSIQYQHLIPILFAASGGWYTAKDGLRDLIRLSSMEKAIEEKINK